MNNEKLIEFLTELTKLTNKYGFEISGCGCVIDGLTGEFRACPQEWGDARNKLDVCSKCIQDFLNEEN